jgi:hypothetical protein
MTKKDIAGEQLSWAICEVGKEKRFYPAIHGRICPPCCGEQREVTLDCPSQCVYLKQARIHEKPRSRGTFDHAAMFPQVQIDQKFLYEHEHSVMGISFSLAKSVQANPSLHDNELIAALSEMASSYQRWCIPACITKLRWPALFSKL